MRDRDKLEPVNLEETREACEFLLEILTMVDENDPAAEVFKPDDYEYPAARAMVDLLRMSKSFTAMDGMEWTFKPRSWMRIPEGAKETR